MQTIFYSWQSDLPNATNRTFIHNCLEKAIKELRAEGAVELDPSPDRDTQGVPGSPDIAETIFQKIDDCAAFVGDVSFINGCRPTPPKFDCDCTRPTPNPNVLCEWGRATKSVGFERIIAVFNEATGKIDDLPFDMRKRRVVPYCLREGDDKTEQQKALVGKFKSALKPVLELPRTSLDLQFGDAKDEKAMGDRIVIKRDCYRPLSTDSIPLLQYQEGADNRWAQATIGFKNAQLNSYYFREKAIYLSFSRLVERISLVVQNTGDRLLRNVRLQATITGDSSNGLLFIEEHQLPELPERTRDLLGKIPGLKNIKFKHLPGDVTIKTVDDRSKILIDFGNVQPKAKVFSQEFYAGSWASQQIEMNGLLFADELSSPEGVALRLEFETTLRQMTMDDLKKSLPEEIESR